MMNLEIENDETFVVLRYKLPKDVKDSEFGNACENLWLHLSVLISNFVPEKHQEGILKYIFNDVRKEVRFLNMISKEDTVER